MFERRLYNRAMNGPVAIIGGTGIGDRFAAMGGKTVHVPTSEGLLRGTWVSLGDRDLILVQRHSVGHKVPPHRVSYAAFALGLRALGVKTCFGTAAVGSMRPEWGPGTLVVPKDFLDLTGRGTTLFNRTVIHTDFSTPLPARSHLIQAGNQLGMAVEDGGTYICGNGPRYETPKEIEVYGKMGDLVGMTAASEAIVMREAGIDYGCLCVVTNLACGIAGDPLSHEEVVDEMNRSGEVAVRLLLAAAQIAP
jgi:5'-methylthioadenosine phosphorylase